MDELFNALKTAYGKGSKYGVSDEAIGRVAALGATANLNAEQIAAFVAAAEPRFKEEQSEADKVRSSYAAKLKELEAAKAELEAKLNGNQPPESKPEDDKVPAWAQLLLEQNKTLTEQNKSFAEKLNAFETAKSAEIAVKQAQEKFGADAWVNGYPELRDSAWAQAMRIYDRTGKSMTADELHTEAMEIFKPLAKAKGLDISKPFQSDGGAGDGNLDMSEWESSMKDLGWEVPKDN